MLRPRAQMALENVGSFQYLMYKDIRKTKSSPEKKQKQKQFRALNRLIPGVQMALDTFSLFSPLVNFIQRCIPLVKYHRINFTQAFKKGCSFKT